MINVYTPLENAPGIDYNYLKNNFGESGVKYFKNLNSTEVAARFTQLKNYFGLKEGEPITKEMWDYAKQNYVKDTHLDNTMTEFFNMVLPKKLQEFLDWGNKNAPVVIPATIASSAAVKELKEKLNSDVNIYRKGGELYTIPSECQIGVTKIDMIGYFRDLKNKKNYNTMTKRTNILITPK